MLLGGPQPYLHLGFRCTDGKGVIVHCTSMISSLVRKRTRSHRWIPSSSSAPTFAEPSPGHHVRFCVDAWPERRLQRPDVCSCSRSSVMVGSNRIVCAVIKSTPL